MIKHINKLQCVNSMSVFYFFSCPGLCIIKHFEFVVLVHCKMLYLKVATHTRVLNYGKSIDGVYSDSFCGFPTFISS